MRFILLVVLVIAIAAGGFAFGVYSTYSGNDVYRWVVTAKRMVQPRIGPFNEYGQLVRYPKNEVACPKQTDKMMVAVVFGQSNAANNGGQRHVGKPNVINFFDGRCFEAADPLLGNDGIQGTVWVPVANALSEQHDFIVLVPLALAGTRVAEWTGRLDRMLSRSLSTVRKSGYSVTHFLWMQGETDANRTKPDDYSAALERLIAKTKEGFPHSKFYVALATHCEPGAEDERIRQAQRKVVNPAADVFEGPNTDLFATSEDRRDGCHYSGIGQLRIARAWQEILQNPAPQPSAQSSAAAPAAPSTEQPATR